MYSGSHKYGRGAASRGGGSKRNSFPPPPSHRNPPSSSSSRLSLGGSRSRTPSSPAPPPPQSADESFRLVGGGEPLPFAAIIKLAPDLVDEIQRVEAHGGAARIKFDSSFSNPGNVIDVGGKEFRFTWADEFRSCDIYEERQSGEDGNGLLVESGLMWRKLNIQRVLDESTQKHVKMRSLECEQTLKSRKTIVLEPGNPSMKSQKALAAIEASPWKHKQKKDFQSKKKNFDPPQGKGRHSVSPLPSSRNQLFLMASPLSTRGTAAESETIVENPTHIQAKAKAVTDSSEKDFSPGVFGRTPDAAVNRDNQGLKPLDLQHSLITLLKENPKGMSLEALEKAVGDVTSNSARRIEPVLKRIATYEPLGRYILKPGVEGENMKSSPEDNIQKKFVSEANYGEVPVPDSGFEQESPANYIKEQVPLNNNFERESHSVENMDPSRHLTDLFGDDEPLDHNGGRAASSSGSDSDSDSGSSSDSASRSRSRSPAASRGVSSSDSDSSNSKEASDVEVDIMSDDDKEPSKLQDTEHGMSTAGIPWSMPETRPVQDSNVGDQDGYASEDVDIENDFLGDNEAQLATASHDFSTSSENARAILLNHDQNQPFGVPAVVNEQEDAETKLKHERPHKKRGSNMIQLEESSKNVKRSKGRSAGQSSVSRHIGSHTLMSPPRSSPAIPNDDHYDNNQFHMTTKSSRIDDANGNVGTERGNNISVPGKSVVDSVQLDQRAPSRSQQFETTNKSVKNSSHLQLDAKSWDMNVHSREDILKQGPKGFGDMQDEEGSSNEKGNGKYNDSPLGQKSSMRSEILYKSHSERSRISHALDSSSKRYPASSPKGSSKSDVNRSPVDKRRLQREVSDLELGELREPLSEEPELSKRQFERVGSFKKSEAKLPSSSSRKANLKGGLANQPITDPGKTSSPNLRGDGRKTGSSTKRMSQGHFGEDAIQPQRDLLSDQQQSRSNRVNVSVLSDKAAEINKLESGESFAKQGMDIEGYGETRRKSHVNASREDSGHERVPRKGKGSKSRKSKSMGDGADKRKDLPSTEGCIDKHKRNELTYDEDISYTKYEKEEPELREPIKSFPEYRDYVQEYQEKYECYCSLNKILENYRNEFQQLGDDLESAKGERYNTIVAQLRERYRQCGTRQKRLKKIFLVLHEELKHLKQRIKDFAADHTRV